MLKEHYDNYCNGTQGTWTVSGGVPAKSLGTLLTRRSKGWSEAERKTDVGTEPADVSGNVLGLGDNTVEYDSNYGREVSTGRLSERGKASILVCACVYVSQTFSNF